MAVLYIAEFEKVATVQGVPTSIALQPPVAEQTVAIGVGSAASSAFNAATKFIRVHTDAICSIKVSTAPTATALLSRMAAGQTEYFGVSPGTKIAVIVNT